MNDDPLTKFTRARTAQPSGPPQPTLPPSLSRPTVEGRESYEAFDNQVRASSVEIRCYRTGLSYSIDYAHLSARVFEFLSGEKLSFSGDGYGFVIKGRNLRELLRAINLHTCGFIQDFHPDHHILPEPVDPGAAYVESIEVVALRPAPAVPMASNE